MKQRLLAILWLFLGCAITFGLSFAFVVYAGGSARDISYLGPELYLLSILAGLLMLASVVIFCVGALALIWGILTRVASKRTT